jgi:hypothetical protein
VKWIVLSLLHHAMQLPQLLVLLVCAYGEAGQRRSTGKHAGMLSLAFSFQPFYVFWQQVLVVVRGDCAGLQKTRVWHRSIGDAGHQEQEILTAWLLSKVAILPSLAGRLQIARFLPVLVLVLCLLLFILRMTHYSQIWLLFHVDRADVWLKMSFGVVYECAVSIIFFVFLLFLFLSCT